MIASKSRKPFSRNQYSEFILNLGLLLLCLGASIVHDGKLTFSFQTVPVSCVIRFKPRTIQTLTILKNGDAVLGAGALFNPNASGVDFKFSIESFV